MIVAHPPTDPRWPVALVTGFLGSGKTTFIRAILSAGGMTDTLVVVNEFGAVGIDDALIEEVHDDVVLLRGGCMCCTLRQDLARTLSDIGRRSQLGSIPRFSRVIIEASGLADPASLIATLTTHPLVSVAFALCSVTTVVDAEAGFDAVAAQPVGLKQIVLADSILVSKTDRPMPSSLQALYRNLRRLSPLATIEISTFGNAKTALLFARDARLGRTVEHAPARFDHAARFQSHVVTAHRPLAWRRVQTWIARLLESDGDEVLRLKGLLTVSGQPQLAVVQAVRHSFYPVGFIAPRPRNAGRSEIVIIVDGTIAPELLESFPSCVAD